MVLISAVRDYVLRMLNEVSGNKVLIVDDDAVRAAPDAQLSPRRDPERMRRSSGASQHLPPVLPLRTRGACEKEAVPIRRCCGDGDSACSQHLAPYRVSSCSLAHAGVEDGSALLVLLQLGMVSLALSQSEILHKDVFLVEKLDSRSQEVMSHLKAVASAANFRKRDSPQEAPRGATVLGDILCKGCQALWLCLAPGFGRHGKYWSERRHLLYHIFFPRSFHQTEPIRACSYLLRLPCCHLLVAVFSNVISNPLVHILC